ncbi:uncharacterized protein MONOS_137 [Monocercomonoides exilis]|uniref:uncharacterized protein n=1 Tax=Monocercomonoides exilis TaxID=2049356 RepID=UPI003559F411|nr:hypothetical protein MONOS_137 [Monocercomonoides exilis]|eukprot:MONOS_137.1-p1 / transcript=MONOS_137.1 / gene=MONOS_137 / organism=Monocercomonoides_exilis_PA203 / gene_product=unspecified product / transcript_product=unspecified product / location=Mono_scaffold00002:272425-273042(+) / protein_length=206 / sequence_SO=supercontig / SO=protein_coding / is_pseudo=false
MGDCFSQQQAYSVQKAVGITSTQQVQTKLTRAAQQTVTQTVQKQIEGDQKKTKSTTGGASSQNKKEMTVLDSLISAGQKQVSSGIDKGINKMKQSNKQKQDGGNANENEMKNDESDNYEAPVMHAEVSYTTTSVSANGTTKIESHHQTTSGRTDLSVSSVATANSYEEEEEESDPEVEEARRLLKKKREEKARRQKNLAMKGASA